MKVPDAVYETIEWLKKHRKIHIDAFDGAHAALNQVISDAPRPQSRSGAIASGDYSQENWKPATR